MGWVVNRVDLKAGMSCQRTERLKLFTGEVMTKGVLTEELEMLEDLIFEDMARGETPKDLIATVYRLARQLAIRYESSLGEGSRQKSKIGHGAVDVLDMASSVRTDTAFYPETEIGGMEWRKDAYADDLPIYTVSQILETDKLSDVIHWSNDVKKTVCGTVLNEDWYIRTNTSDRPCNCPDCYRVQNFFTEGVEHQEEKP